MQIESFSIKAYRSFLIYYRLIETRVYFTEKSILRC